MELDVGITPDEGGQGRGGEEVGTQVLTSDTCKPWEELWSSLSSAFSSETSGKPPPSLLLGLLCQMRIIVMHVRVHAHTHTHAGPKA